MSKRADPMPLGGLPVLLGALVVAELLFLRTATRTLVHIPGLGRFETPITALAEVGRWGYFLATVSLVAILAALAYRGLRQRDTRGRLSGAATALFLVVAGAGRAGLLTPEILGWSSLATVVIVTAASWRGPRTLPIALFTLGSFAAGASVLAQGSGGGLSGRQVDTLVLVAEISLILAGVTTPLLLDMTPRPPAVFAGLAAATLGVGALVTGGSTLSILVLWNLGVPGWLSGVAYALALGAMVTTLWSSFATRDWLRAIGLFLMLAGGLGVISTYQTGLVVAGIMLIGMSLDEEAVQDSQPVEVVPGNEIARSMAGTSA